MTVRQAAENIGISASLVYDLCREGIIKHTRHGRPGRRGTIRISDEAVAEYLAACERTGGADDRSPLRHIR
ncbi:MAG TPA: helix-turn-helix domain-containing protein [Gemmataceae bacterium]|nr:helix-turn-helix domain-containing protein [Gemmataceae bacterium]